MYIMYHLLNARINTQPRKLSRPLVHTPPYARARRDINKEAEDNGALSMPS